MVKMLGPSQKRALEQVEEKILHPPDPRHGVLLCCGRRGVGKSILLQHLAANSSSKGMLISSLKLLNYVYDEAQVRLNITGPGLAAAIVELARHTTSVTWIGFTNLTPLLAILAHRDKENRLKPELSAFVSTLDRLETDYRTIIVEFPISADSRDWWLTRDEIDHLFNERTRREGKERSVFVEFTPNDLVGALLEYNLSLENGNIEEIASYHQIPGLMKRHVAP